MSITVRLRLRPPRLEDAATLSALITPLISGFTATWPHPYSVAMAERRIHEALAAHDKAMGCYRVLTLQGGDDRMIGWLAMGLSETALPTGTLSYWLGEAHHRQGYLTEALPVFVGEAVAALGLTRIIAGARPDNAASIAALVRLGMHKIGEGPHYVPARQRDEICVFYALDDASKAFSPSR
ncbi:MAG: GNAT family N-acetyltransferase [Ferrovibrio sp.]|nr:GNAT family N-acetyltransferase [Ferrovibrio sp.]